VERRAPLTEPVAAPGNYDFARAVREYAFVQVSLLHLNEFRTAAKERGLDTLALHDNDPWETLDREGLLPPVAYALHGFAWHHETHHHLDQGALLIRDEVGYRPWADLREEAQARYEADLRALYHHWQLISYADVLDSLRPSVLWQQLGQGLESFYEMRARTATAVEGPPREQLLERAADARAQELLLVRVQNYFYPRERGHWIGGHVLGLTDDAMEWAEQQGREADFTALADDCGVDVDALTEAYTGLVWRARRLDPNERIFVLLDALKSRTRARLQGAALRALDLYQAARVIRAWHAQLVEEPLPDVDDFERLNPEWKENRYGTMQLRFNREPLPAILDDHGLYPYRVQLIGEGDSELAALREVLIQAYGLRFERLGVIPVDIGGASVPAGVERLLGALRVYANYFLLVFDNEGRARELVEELERRGVVEGVSDEQRRRYLKDALESLREQTFASDEERARALRGARKRAARLEEQPRQAPEFLIWRDSLEADNFSDDELCAAINDEAAARDIADFAITPEALGSARAGDDRAVASVLLGLAETHDPPLQLSKPDFARALARYAVKNPDRDGQRRPLLVLAEHLVRLAQADRALVGRLRQ
jgi:hypothetical protein